MNWIDDTSAFQSIFVSDDKDTDRVDVLPMGPKSIQIMWNEIVGLGCVIMLTSSENGVVVTIHFGPMDDRKHEQHVASDVFGAVEAAWKSRVPQ